MSILLCMYIHYASATIWNQQRIQLYIRNTSVKTHMHAYNVIYTYTHHTLALTHTRIDCIAVHSTRFTSGRVMRTSVSSRKRRQTLVPSTHWQPLRNTSSQVLVQTCSWKWSSILGISMSQLWDNDINHGIVLVEILWIQGFSWDWGTNSMEVYTCTCIATGPW